LYRSVYEDLLAIPVTKGRKTEKERFAGGFYTTTIAAFISPNGRAIQAATSHSLGQNFSKIFNITFENEHKEKAWAWQNSWGLTTRSIGIMIMVHGDDKGLIIPPRVAPIQIIIVPIYTKTNMSAVDAKCNEIVSILLSAGFRAEADLRESYRPGHKYNHWETKGVPLRFEVGENDIKQNQVLACRRDTKEKISVPLNETFTTAIKDLLENIQISLFEKAKKEKEEHRKQTTTWTEFILHLNNKNTVLVPFCCSGDCEDKVKIRSAADSKANQSDMKFELTGSAKSLCIPFDQPELKPGTKCFAECGSDAVTWTLFGRSY